MWVLGVLGLGFGAHAFGIFGGHSQRPRSPVLAPLVVLGGSAGCEAGRGD